jgi:hypothetical protein
LNSRISGGKMKIETKKIVLTGKVEKDDYNDYLYKIGYDAINDVLYEFKHKNVKITIEEINENEN